MSNVTTIGIDLAKNSVSVHGVDAGGAVVLRKTVSRARLMGLLMEQPPSLIGLEACSGAHEWARRLQRFGHTVKLMAPRFVTPYRKNGKNDGNDAEAICEAVSRPHMRFIPIKTPEQQAVLCLHRVRQGFIEERTATINRLRGLLAEFGFVLPQSSAAVRRGVAALLEQLPAHAARALGDLREHLRSLDARVREYEQAIEAHARESEAAQLAQQRQGIGPLTASAIVASVGDVREFKNGRQFSAWLGLVPRQHSTGGKQRRGTSPVVAIPICALFSSWEHAAFCSALQVRAIRCLVGRSPCELVAAITAPASRSQPRTLGLCGQCSASHRRPTP
jgi:transposase